ncbi:MAG TPA: VPLPA-CTERM sorting domain-containing protein [Cellvibrionaceae bacterium]|nr:VPLPA-CTERM sorting domain-containing protein [Cellvibrionaceae bacterium]
MKSTVLAIGFALACGLCTPLHALTVAVPGTANPWLAGMPDGATSSEDSAPGQSPIFIDLTQLGPGNFLTFTSLGNTDNGGGMEFGAEGDTSGWVIEHSYGVENGIADSALPFLSLTGVFLDDNQPDGSPSPEALNYNSLTTSFTSFAAQLKQPFFIGDGLSGRGTGDIQHFLIPTHATRLYLGTADGYGWNNNGGLLLVSVSAVPTPANAWLMVAGLGLFGLMTSRRKRFIAGH